MFYRAAGHTSSPAGLVHRSGDLGQDDPTACETKDMPAPSPRFLTLADVAEVLNVTVRQVYALVRAGDLRGIQVGGRGQWRIEAVELEDYISRQYARADQSSGEVSAAEESSDDDALTTNHDVTPDR